MTYDYICTACGHVWEADQRISEDPLKDCPSCNAAAAKRQISGGAGFILKGGGWYSDLYSSTGGSSSGNGSGSGSGAGSKAAAASSDASPCAGGACGTSACPAASGN